LLVRGQREEKSKLGEGTLEAKLMNSFFFQVVYWACECNAKELAVYNEIKMKRVREVYALLAKKENQFSVAALTTMTSDS